ncbi:MAG: 50S ribosomal protein L17 [Bacteroidota bacterium]|jgi:large subunit ribosomal protein L17|nr:50S ribosomal protein L17 [Bacteroidales bacterium]MDI9535569.1 50S ribosomal protein L17 [Bacteroidota bacterium]OQC44904.1 MAG: 50S ribosomal protein L17 [Bacteroidetes bacterium ADurb.Bin028]NLP20302.1 50S ribosomal protein L17 [Bacteroidales bacterium]HNY43414.1 50S ribosomal protein L17 [Bacteroidales bacterium]
MRHNKKFNHLGRTSAHRQAMLSNMAASLIVHKRIRTTVAKAKALRVYIEPLLTKSKEDTTHNRRVVFSYLENKEAVAELFRDVAVKIADRPGGYTRILRTGTRLGDNADMCIIELVDYNEAMLEAKETKKKTSRRSRGRKSGKAKTEEQVQEVEEVVSNTENALEETAVETTEEPVAEEPVAEVEESVEEEKDQDAEEKK